MATFPIELIYMLPFRSDALLMVIIYLMAVFFHLTVILLFYFSDVYLQINTKWT